MRAFEVGCVERLECAVWNEFSSGGIEYLIETISTNCRLLLACSVLKLAMQSKTSRQVNQKYLLNPEALFSSLLLYYLKNRSVCVILTRIDCSYSLSYSRLCA